MTGGGGEGGGGGRDFPPGGSPDDCGSLLVETMLSSPVPAVIATLKKGQLLTVEIAVTTKGASGLVAKDSAGAVAGSLTPPSLVKIISCITKGFKYVAEIIDITGGAVRVRIRAK